MSWISRLKEHVVPSHTNAYQPHLIRRTWLVVFLMLVLMIEGFLVTNLVARQANTSFLAAVIPAVVADLTNAERSGEGLPQLHVDKKLTEAAQAKANDMAAHGYFSHVGPDGKVPWQWMRDIGYDYKYAGENLAVRFVDSQDVVRAWMASPTHRANIEKAQFTNIGIGVANGLFQGVPATYIVQFFGTPLFSDNAAAAAAPQTSQSITQQVMRALQHMQGKPVSTANVLLAIVATIMLIVLISTVVFHFHIQPTRLVSASAVISATAILLIFANMHFLKPQTTTSMSASALLGAQEQVLVVDDSATSTVFSY